MGTRNARLLDLAYEPILIRDANDRITFWNRGAERVYGWDRESALGQVSHELLHTEFPEPMETILDTLRRNGQWQGELLHTARNGVRVPVASQWASYEDPAEGLLTLETNFDLSERRAAELQLRQLNSSLEQRIQERTRELQESNTDLEAFSYSVSHDLRAPLRAMRGFADALREDYGHTLDETGLSYLKQIEDGASRMAQLIDDLLAYSRLGRATISTGPVSVLGAVQRALEQGPDLVPCVQVVVPEETAVVAHRQTLVQAIFNLLTNACKFVRPGTRAHVSVMAKQVRDRVRILVEDDGIGIAPEHQARIFQVFERLHGQETYPGTGIGLAIVRRSMERMNGTAGVESTEGKGSRFWLELPAVQSL